MSSSMIEIDENQLSAILERVARLESRLAAQGSLNLSAQQSKEEVLQLTSRCQHLETQVTILSNELEKQRVLLASKDKWTDVMEDLQASYAKQRG
jgi:ABC-type phosphate transport system auxiliary subunit